MPNNTFTWIGPSGGNFDTAADWDQGAVPGATNEAVIASALVNVTSSNSVDSLTLGSAAVLNITAGTFSISNTNQSGTNSGTIDVGPGTAISLAGTETNAGLIALNGSGGSGAELLVSGPTLTLSGSGTVSLNNDGSNTIAAATAGDKLINVSNTIVGAGVIGGGGLILTNQAKGVIDGSGNANLVLNTGTSTIINQGTIEETGGNTLTIESKVNNLGGIIDAVSGVIVLSGGTIQAGALKTGSGAAIEVGSGGGALDGSSHALTNDGLVQINPGQSLTLLGSIVNNGTGATIFLDGSGGSGGGLIIGSGTVTLSGGGTVSLDNDSVNTITAATAGNELVNVNNVITGAGQIGGGSLNILNEAAGTIEAVGNSNLVINTGTSATTTNDGLMESAQNLLIIKSLVDSSGGGTIKASGDNVLLQGATLVGGTLVSAPGFAIEANGASTLDGSAHVVTNTGLIQVDPGVALTLLGSIVNSSTATIDLNGSGGSGAELIIGSPTVTLSGGGTVSLNNDSVNAITGATAGDTLINVDNTIVGAGQIGAGTLTLVNDTKGVIDAVGNNNLVLNTGANAIINDGLIEETTGNVLFIDSVVNNTGGGVIEAAGSGGAIELTGGTLQGGTLETLSNTSIQAVSGASTLDGSSQAVTNDGYVQINQGQTLTLLGSIINNGSGGTIYLNGSGGSGSVLQIGSPTVTLSGGGTVSLDNDGVNAITGAAASDTLINVNNTIVGAGQIGAGQLTLINDAGGTIDAVGNGNLVLNTGANVVTNDGLLEETTGNILFIDGVVNNSGGGIIDASGSGGAIELTGGTLQGGTLLTASNTSIQAASGASTLDGSSQAVTNDGFVQVDQAQSLTLLGSIVNNATIFLAGSGGSGAGLVVGSNPLTLSGGGTISLDNDSANTITAGTAGNELVNVNNVITGAGVIGGNSLNILNEIAGTIEANGNSNLVINTGTTGAVTTNDGLMESAANELIIQSLVDNFGGGTIFAQGANVVLQAATLVGGTLASNAGFAIEINTASTLDGSAHVVTNTGLIAVDQGVSLTLLGTIANASTATIALNGSGGSGSGLVVGSGTVTLSGGGTISLDNDSANAITAGTAGNELVNVNNVITGAGQLGGNSLNILNEAAGTIEANGNSNLVINTGTAAVTTNDGLMESAANELIIRSLVDSSGGGTIAATGANVVLQGATLVGGTLNSRDNVAIEINSASTLDGSAHVVTNIGTIAVDQGVALTLLGSIVNSGTAVIELNGSGGSGSELLVASPTVTLSGGGTVSLDNDTSNSIIGAVASDTLINVDNTIVGAGQIGGGQLTLVNDTNGVIAGSGNSNLVLNTGTNIITNDGLIEEISGNSVFVDSVVNNASSGVIDAVNGAIELTGGTFQGGTLETGGNGSIQVGSGNGTFDGSSQALTNDGFVQVNQGQTLTLLGSIINNGTILLNGSGGSGSGLVASGKTVTLSGSGTISLNNDGANSIAGSVGTLVNNGNTIIGAGSIGSSTMTIINKSGAIEANGNSNLVINVGTHTIQNSGLIAANGGNLTIIQGKLNNIGTLSAISGNLTLDSGVTNTALSGGTLSGGTWTATSGTLSITGGSIVTDAATIILTGSGSEIQAGNGTTFTPIEQTLTTIATKSSLAVLGNRNYTTSNAITDNGTLQLGGGTFSAASISIAAGAQLDGFGTISASTLSNAGTLSAVSGNLSLAPGVNNTALSGGKLTGGTWIANNGTLSLTGGSIVTDAATIILSGSGSEIQGGNGSTFTTLEQSLTTIAAKASLAVLGNRNYSTSNAIADNGTLQLGGGSFSAASLTIASGAQVTGYGTVTDALSNPGTISASGGTLVLSNTVTNTGVLSAAAGAVLDLQGSGNSIKGTLSGGGTVQFDGSTTTLQSGAKLSVSTLGIVNGAKVTLGSNFSYGGVLDETGGSTATTLDLATFTLTLTGSGNFMGGSQNAVVDGPGTLGSKGSLLLSGVTLGGGATLSNSGTVTQTGSVVLGDANGAGKIVNTGSYNIAADVGISPSGSGASSITNNDVFAKTSGTGTSTISATFTNASTGTIDVATGTLDLAGTTTLAGTITGAGVLDVGGLAKVTTQLLANGTSLNFLGGLNNSGTIVESGGTLFVGSGLAGTGTIEVSSNGALSFGAATFPAQAHTNFLDATGTIDIASAGAFHPTIGGMVAGDIIDLTNVAVGTVKNLSYSGSVLSVNTTHGTDNLTITGAYTTSNFGFATDNHTGTIIQVHA